MAQNGTGVQLQASQACISCRKQKRKCDKSLPTCTLCLRMIRPCDYSDATPAPNAEDFAQLQQKVTELESRLDKRVKINGKYNGSIASDSMSPPSSLQSVYYSSSSLTFPPVFFLEPQIFIDSHMSIPRPLFAIPAHVQATLGDIRAVTETFYSTIHLWLPIVSKKRLQLTLSNPDLEMSPDLALLFLAMKLIIEPVANGIAPAETTLYHMVRQFYNMVESSAFMSLHLIQSLLLIATYELGHAIYPAAYITTGHCARLGYALGLHRRRKPLQMIKRPGAWAEIEEMNRAWWATMLLDRYANLGGRERPLATEDPLRTHMLPAEDELWDHGELTTTEPLYVSTPTSVKAGAFARTAQATHLLGRMIRLRNEQQDDSPMKFTEAQQIHRTITALTKLLIAEVETDPLRFGTAAALCFAALLHLCDLYACTESNQGEHTVGEIEMQTVAIAGLKQTSADALRLSQLLRMAMATNPLATSPLTADCLYQAATQYAWLVYEVGNDEYIVAYRGLAQVLSLMSSRWAVASEYLKILEMARESLYDNNASLALTLRTS